MASGKGIDLVLIHPGNRSKIYQSLGETLSGIEPPVWATIIGTYVRRRGHSVAIVDPEAENLSAEETAQRVADLDPVLAVVVVYGHQPSASTQNMTIAGEICAAIRQTAPGLKTAMVGGHVAAVPQRSLEDEDVDFVSNGEGPLTVLELLEALKAGETDLSKVRGLLYRENGGIVTTRSAPNLQALEEEVPELAWDLLSMSEYRAHNWHCFGDLKRQPYAAIYTTLGCPYHCTFCCIQAPFKNGEQVLGFTQNVNTYRFWSPESVVNQIGTLVEEHGVRNLRILDEMFVLNARHVNGICDLIIERGYDLNMWAYARIDTIRSQETVDKMKAAGFNWLCFGIESASERVREDVDKSISQEKIYEVVDQVRSAGINVIANFIFGLPEDDLEAMQMTLDMALDLNAEFVNFYSAMAYPGSQLYDLALQKGWPLPEKWSGFSQHSVDTLPLPTNYLSGSEVLAFRDEAWQKYFESPDYLAMVERKFGTLTVEHIKDMASHTLVREHLPAS